MKKIAWVVFGMAASSLAIAGSQPLATLHRYNGTFVWIKVGALPSKSLKTMSNAKSIVLDVLISKDTVVKKDEHGNQWFTFIVADQGPDWKWNQTKGSGAIKLTGGKVKAGHYTVTVPVAGIPASVLKGKAQTFNVGPNTSGTSTLTDVVIENVRGQ